MTIALLLNPIDERSPAGLGRSVYQFARGLIEQEPEQQFILISKQTIDTARLFPGAGNIRECISLKGGKIWSTSVLKLRSDIDLLITFTPVVPRLAARTKLITFAHDFAFMEYGSVFRRLALYVLYLISFRRSAHICAVSAHTAAETTRLFRIPPQKISVVYNGYDHRGTLPQSAGVPAPYFLMVGVLKERKNALRVIEAFAQFHAAHPSYTLQIAGKHDSPYGRKVISAIEAHGLQDAVSLLGFVSDATLGTLYAQATALLYPSLLEGFGIPILEAMARGVPVVTSNKGVLAEVAGDAAVLVEAKDPALIAAGMATLLDPLCRETLIARGHARSAAFPWGTSISRLSAVIKKVMEETRAAV